MQKINFGSDGEVIKGGVFFGELTPGGVFSNVPKKYQYNIPTSAEESSITLTLEKIKDSLKEQLLEEEKFDASNVYVERFLYEFTQLLIDYRDMRNYIFFGSANTEIAYNIKKIIEIFPYKFFISALTESFNNDNPDIKIINDLNINQTSIIFPQHCITDGIEQFCLRDNTLGFNWKDYMLVDGLDNQYKVLSVISPYIDNTNVFKILEADISTLDIDFDNYLTGLPDNLTFDTLRIKCTPDCIMSIGDVISIKNANATLNNEYVIAHVDDEDYMFLVNKVVANNFDYALITSNDAITDVTLDLREDSFIRFYPIDSVQEPFTIKMVIEGNLFKEQLIVNNDFEDSISGFIISPNNNILSEFQYNLTEVQKILLSPSPLNPNPWPRREITNNIKCLLNNSKYNPVEVDFVEWIKDPNFLFIKRECDDNDISFSDTYGEYRLIRALGLDETETNQLVRRCIPQDLISEIYDTPNADFQRFILIAGWFFDQIKLYIDFIKYTHHINVSDFNQLSPEYYRYYASHYGLELFTDDGIDFSKLVVKTEPGLYFRDKAMKERDTKFYQLTLQKLQYERQKRLLLSLFYLYKTKGTHGAVNKLISLLGAPDGFFVFLEYAFELNNIDSSGNFDINNMTGHRIEASDKVHVPKYSFIIDETITQEDGLPPVYKTILNNETTYNLRQVSSQTSPNGAIETQIINVFGNNKHSYIKFEEGEFSNLQNIKPNEFCNPPNVNDKINEPYYFLPLTIPDKYTNFTIEYMIPRGGFKSGNDIKGIISDIHICSLFEISETTYDTEGNIKLNNEPYIYPMPPKINNGLFPSNNFQNDLDFLQHYSKIYNYNEECGFIISKMEGKDLVVRVRIKSEIDNNYHERIAIVEDIFSDDGLNHTLKIILNTDGIEVLKDYVQITTKDEVGYVTLHKWYLPTYNVLTFDKTKIKTLTPTNLEIHETESNNTGQDKINNWDLFIGFPTDIDFYFKRIMVAENYSLNSFNSKDGMRNNENYSSEYWNFDCSMNEGSNIDFKIRCEFGKMNPNLFDSDYSFQLPIEGFNNKQVVKDLSLTPKQLINKENIKYEIRKQDFFETDNIFVTNAWENNLHMKYNYGNFNNKVTELYRMYSPQVLNYASLTSFLDLIENKFKPLIESFIPIVVNISEFGRLISNTMFKQPKMRYYANTNCIKPASNSFFGRYSILQVRLFDLISKGLNMEVELVNDNYIDTEDFSEVIIPPLRIDWNETTEKTLMNLLFAIRQNLNLIPALKINLNDNNLILFIDAFWYAQNFNGLNSNNLKLIVKTYSDDYETMTNYIELKFDNGNPVANTNDSCLSIEYKLPLIGGRDKYIYFESENQDNETPTTIYFDEENKDDDTYLIFD